MVIIFIQILIQSSIAITICVYIFTTHLLSHSLMIIIFIAKLSPVEASMKLSWLYSQLYPARPPTRESTLLPEFSIDLKSKVASLNG